MSLISIDNSVPDFEALATGNKLIKLSDYLGKYVVLYFYPKDNTPGCTEEALDFKENYEKFIAFNAVVLGVSRDSASSHEKFKEKHALPFDLLSDSDEKLCSLFDVIKMKNMYGKQVRGIERSTFFIDPQGLLVHEWRKIRLKSHCEEVLHVLQDIQ